MRASLGVPKAAEARALPKWRKPQYSTNRRKPRHHERGGGTVGPKAATPLADNMHEVAPPYLPPLPTPAPGPPP